MKKAILAAVISIAAMAGQAHASPMTFYFSGVINEVDTYDNQTPVFPQGKTFSGSFVFDTEGIPMSQGMYNKEAVSGGGCFSRTNGTCDSYQAPTGALVSNWQLQTDATAQGTYSPILQPTGYQISTVARHHSPSGRNGSYQYSSINRRSDRVTTAGGIHEDFVMQEMDLLGEKLFNLDFDLSGPLDFSQGNHRLSYAFMDRDMVCAGQCVYTYSPDSFSMTGTITAGRFVAGALEVPEPASIALIVTGLAGLGISRKRQRA